MTVKWEDFTDEQKEYITQRTREASNGGINWATRYVVVLDKYEMDNLLWLFNAIGYKVFQEHESFRSNLFQALNTGDWNGQIPWKLKEAIEKVHTEYHPYVWSPNVRDAADFLKRVNSTARTFVGLPYE